MTSTAEATSGNVVAKSAMLHRAPPELWSLARTWWRRVLELSRRPPRRLRLAEHLSLGERRFVAVVEFDGSRFLVGGTSASLVLLAQLSPSPPDDPDSRVLAKEQE